MKLSIHEKRIIFQILVSIMNADSVQQPEEMDFLDRVFKDFNLTIEEFDHMDDIDMDYLINEYSKFSDDVKEYAQKLFIGMASCDGFVDPRELSIINDLKSRLSYKQ